MRMTTLLYYLTAVSLLLTLPGSVDASLPGTTAGQTTSSAPSNTPAESTSEQASDSAENTGIPAEPTAESLKRRAQRAVASYEAGLVATDRTEQVRAFETAQIEFRQILETHECNGQTASPQLWLAFANASLKSEQPGWAILAYRKTLQIAPDNVQAKTNLAFARGSLQAVPTLDASEADAVWSRFLPVKDLLLISAILFFVAGLLLSASLWLDYKWMRWIAILPMLLCVLIGVADLFTQRGRGETGVVVGPQAFLRTADLPDSPLQQDAPVKEGTELTIIRRRNTFFEVVHSASTGWISGRSFRSVAEPFDLAQPISRE